MDFQEDIWSLKYWIINTKILQKNQKSFKIIEKTDKK